MQMRPHEDFSYEHVGMVFVAVLLTLAAIGAFTVYGWVS